MAQIHFQSPDWSSRQRKTLPSSDLVFVASLSLEHIMSIRAYMAIMAERDAAIRERNMALEERKRAFAERDMAMLQRDAAIAERNSAMQETEEVIAALQFQENSMNDTNITPDSPGDAFALGANNIHNQQQMHHMAESIYGPVELPTSGTFQTTGMVSDSAKPRTVRHSKEAREISTKSSRSQRVGKNVPEDRSEQLIIVTSNDGDGQDLDNTKDDTWKDNLGLNQVNFDESSMPVPVCSCTGVPQQCYKWGNGGWQSACCTTTMSMYPLPQASGKKYSRVGGRKMSGSAFTKLLNRLVTKGNDLSAPVDLKDHWAKHGTNRYSTLK